MFIIARKHISPRRMLYRAGIAIVIGPLDGFGERQNIAATMNGRRGNMQHMQTCSGHRAWFISYNATSPPVLHLPQPNRPTDVDVVCILVPIFQYIMSLRLFTGSIGIRSVVQHNIG